MLAESLPNAEAAAERSDLHKPRNEKRMWPHHRLATIAAAVLFAALAPAVIAAALSGTIELAPVALRLTLAHTLVLGLPCFLVLESKGRVSVISAIAAGFIIGATPIGLFWLTTLGGNSSASSNGLPTIVNGWPTMAGWLEYLKLLIQLGSFGALASFAFWFTLRICNGLVRSGRSSSESSLEHGRYARNMGPAAGLTVAVLLTSGVFAIPAITMDRTCHNMFRDGRTSVGPQVNMDLRIGMEEWPKLTEIFDHFAATHGLSLRNSSRDQPGVVRVLALSLCTDQGTNIEVIDQRWASKGFVPLIDGRGVPIAVYEQHENASWQPLTRDLLAQFESRWPGMIEFRDGQGHAIPMPKELQGGSPNSTDAPRPAPLE